MLNGILEQSGIRRSIAIAGGGFLLGIILGEAVSSLDGLSTVVGFPLPFWRYSLGAYPSGGQAFHVFPAYFLIDVLFWLGVGLGSDRLLQRWNMSETFDQVFRVRGLTVMIGGLLFFATLTLLPIQPVRALGYPMAFGDIGSGSIMLYTGGSGLESLSILTPIQAVPGILFFLADIVFWYIIGAVSIGTYERWSS